MAWVNQGSSNYAGQRPTVGAGTGQPYYQQQQPQFDARQVVMGNVNRLTQILNPAIGNLINMGRLNNTIANQFYNWITGGIRSGDVGQYISDHYGFIQADDRQLSQVIDYYLNCFMQQAAASNMQPGYMQQPQFVPQNQFGQPMYNTMNVPTWQQPQQNSYWQPRQPQFVQQQYAQPQYVQQPYGRPAPRGGTDVDGIYGNRSVASTSANYMNGAPMPNATGNKVYTQQPQVSTVKPQQRPAQKTQQPPLTPSQNERMMNAGFPNSDPNGYDKVTIGPDTADITEQVDAEDYPNDDWGNKDKHGFIAVLAAFRVEYQKRIRKRKGEIKRQTITVREIGLCSEPAPNVSAAIKRAVNANVNKDKDDKFAYLIDYKEQVVLDIPYAVGKECHDTMESLLVESDDINPEKIMSNGIAIARDLIKEFKKLSPAYQKAVAPVIIGRFNDYVRVASTVLDPDTGSLMVMGPIDSMDELYAALDFEDAKFQIWKSCDNYADMIMNALKCSLFAVYTPCSGGNYLRIDNDRERAAMLANPDIGVVVNYGTDRWQDANNTRAISDNVNEKVDKVLKQRFVITVAKRIVYMNIGIPLKNNKDVNFKLHKFDLTDGDHVINAMLADACNDYWANCIPYIITTEDPTTKTLPYMVAKVMTGSGYLARRVIAA